MAESCERKRYHQSKVGTHLSDPTNALPLTQRRGGSGATRQAAALRTEGVVVGRSALGEYTIDFDQFGWFPDILPSDLAEDETSSEDESDEA